MATRGIHVVWTTYMTWLPGDPRGHWSPMLDMYGRLRAAGHRINLPDAVTAAQARRSAVDPPKILKPAERVLVAHELSHHVRWPIHSPRLAGGDADASIDGRGTTKQRDETPGVGGCDGAVRMPGEHGKRCDTPGKPGAMWGERNAPVYDKLICHAAAVEDNHVHLLFGPVGEDIGKFVGRLKGRTASELRKLPINRERQRIWTGGYWKVFLFDDDALAAVARYIEQHHVRRGVDASPYDWVTPIGR